MQMANKIDEDLSSDRWKALIEKRNTTYEEWKNAVMLVIIVSFIIAPIFFPLYIINGIKWYFTK